MDVYIKYVLDYEHFLIDEDDSLDSLVDKVKDGFNIKSTYKFFALYDEELHMIKDIEEMSDEQKLIIRLKNPEEVTIEEFGIVGDRLYARSILPDIICDREEKFSLEYKMYYVKVYIDVFKKGLQVITYLMSYRDYIAIVERSLLAG